MVFIHLVRIKIRQWSVDDPERIVDHLFLLTQPSKGDSVTLLGTLSKTNLGSPSTNKDAS